MRIDKSLSPKAAKSSTWNRNYQSQGGLELITEDSSGKLTLNSWSGFERNRFFINNAGESFADVSGLSAADSVADGRCFCKWDFDRDGWTDMAVINVNAPTLNIYQNQMGKTSTQNNFVAIKLIGGNNTDQPSKEWSNRDAIGSKITLKAGSLTIVRELRCGEGFAAQNSNTLLIGIGSAKTASNITISWPSGKTTVLPMLSSGKLLTVFENPPATTPNVIIQPYSKPHSN